MMSPLATIGTPRNERISGCASGHQPRNRGSWVMSSVRKGRGSASIAPSIPCVRGSGPSSATRSSLIPACRNWSNSVPSSSGIPRAASIELARRGFEVVATMRDPAAGAGLSDEAQEAGGRLRVQALDVTQPDMIRLPDGLRVLVNNAGVEREHLPVEETPLELWREMFETNVFGLGDGTSSALPVVRGAGRGVRAHLG